MPKRKIVFANDCFYHVFNRGVDKRVIYQDKDDFNYFIHRLKDFNDVNSYKGARISHLPKYSKLKKLRSRTSKLVEVYAYSLLPNHFHMVLQQKVDNGISKYMQKLLTGYTNFFNKKYDRSGSLFQGAFKAKEIDDDWYLKNVLIYVTFNYKMHNINTFRSSKDDIEVFKLMKKFYDDDEINDYGEKIISYLKERRELEN